MELSDLTQHEVGDDYTVKTYNYLRITMVVMVLLLFLSVFEQADTSGCFRTSISAYYYTPVRAIFVSTLVAIGAMLIIIKGRTDVEDAFLNLAGMAAPIVAFVPTSQNATCRSKLDTTPVGEDFSALTLANIDNNLTTLVYAGAIGLTLTLLLMIRNRVDTDTGQWVGLGAMGAAFFIVAAIYYGDEAFFVRHAHGWAALILFLFLILAIVYHVAHRWGDEQVTLLPVYLVIAGLMVAGVVVYFVFDWTHKVLHIEMYELTLFAIYWALQTADYWNDGNRISSADTAR